MGFRTWLSKTPREQGDIVILREVEYCEECKETFLSLYPLKKCEDHLDLDEV